MEEDKVSEHGDRDDVDMESDVELSDEKMGLLMAVEERLATNPADYDGHLRYIALLKECKLVQRLRAARTQFAKQFPLSPSLWNEWLSDELSNAATAEDINILMQLFKDAVKDYVSVEIWQQYLEASAAMNAAGAGGVETGGLHFVCLSTSSQKHTRNVGCQMGHRVAQEIDPEAADDQPTGQEKMLQLFECALRACGAHITSGGALYTQLRTYLQRFVDAALARGDDGPDTVAAVAKVRDAWHRQLKTPLADGAATLAAYKEWEASLPEGLRAEVAPKLEKAAASAQAVAAVRMAYEAAIADDVPADEALLQAFIAYIEFEQAANNSPRLTLLYERAITRFPVTVSLWEKLTEHLEQSEKDPNAILQCYSRAVRNCPWSGSLWGSWLRALERLAEDGTLEGGVLASGVHWATEHESIHARALQAGLKGEEDYLAVLLARLDMLRRTTKGAPLTDAFAAATQLMAAYFPKFVDAEFRIPQYWARCEATINGDMAAAREVWKSALQGGLGKLWHAHSAYIELEAAFGDAEHGSAHFRSILSRKFAEPQGAAMCARAWLRFERQHGTAAGLFAAKGKSARLLSQAAAAPAPPAKGGAQPDTREPPQGSADKKAGKKKGRAAEGEAEARPPKRPKAAKDHDSAAAASEPPHMPAKKFDTANTVYIKHLPPDVTAEQIRNDVLTGVSGIKDVRLSVGKGGVGKGFAYVEMEDTAAVAVALEKNDMLYCGKYLYVAKSKPPKEGHAAGAGRGDGAGRGRGSGPGRGRGGRSAGGRWGADHMHQRVNLREDNEAPATAAAIMTPRVVMKSAPKSNADFRKLLG